MIEIYPDGNPLISVIMLTYNRAQFLDRSIPSFLNQTFKNAELLIIDDGSNDDTFNVVSRYMASYENIRYMRHSNRKIPLSRNVGIKAASGKYIAFLDSDDEYKMDYLEKRIEFMQSHPEVDLVEGGVIIVGDPYVKDKNDLTKKIHLSDCHIGATFFGKAEVFNALGGFDKNILYSEESEFWERAEKRFVLKKYNHPGYIYYRDTPDGICNSI